ncbi:MAG: methionine synthase [Actinomycetota bacterium]|nr:methionine synthase [Actinomycetota bacterium]
MTTRWPAGAGTGIGSMPGVDPVETVRLIFGELPALPFLPELPNRGAGADMIGRTAALLVDMPTEIVASGWQFASSSGRDNRRARDFLSRDLDALELAAAGYAGALKVQLVGPWTLASGIELPSGHKVVSDHGAARDLGESLSEGLRLHLADISSRVPAAQLVVQVDEPGLAAVLSGQVPTPSGFGTVRSVETSVVEQGLRRVLEVAPAGGRVVHSCASDVPLALIRRAGADGISVDLTQLGGEARPRHTGASVEGRGSLSRDELGAAVDAGVSLWLGVLGSTDVEIRLTEARDAIRRLWRELGFAPELLASSVVPTPSCGLANASPGYARRVLTALRELGAELLVDRE